MLRYNSGSFWGEEKKTTRGTKKPFDANSLGFFYYFCLFNHSGLREVHKNFLVQKKYVVFCRNT